MYRLKANTSAKRGPATGEAKMIGFEHESPERAKPQLATFGTVLVVRSGTGAPSFFVPAYMPRAKKAHTNHNVVPCKGTSRGHAERALAVNMLSTGQKV